MNLLIDSHVFIWSYDQPQKLSDSALNAMSSPANTLFLSVGSVWEIQIKMALGKLSFQDPLAEILNEQHTVNGLQFLPVTLSHALYLENLPLHHKDPFDHLLITQAMVERMTIVSADDRFSDYAVDLIW